jgi:hypothetical protein
MNRAPLALLRLALALTIAVTIGIQIGDRVVHGAFDPAEYFSYFTIQSALIDVVVFAAGAVIALRLPRDTVLFTAVRASALAYAVVTAGVYNLLLRGVPYEGFAGLQWPNEVLHVWVPLAILLDWLFAPGRPALPWTTLRLPLVFPVAWLVYTLARGAATDGYPYPFLDPATAGWGSVVGYIVALSAFILGLAALGVLHSRRSEPDGERRHARRRGRRKGTTPPTRLSPQRRYR